MYTFQQGNNDMNTQPTIKRTETTTTTIKVGRGKTEELTMTYYFFDLDVTIAGETRQVEFSMYKEDSDRATSTTYVALCKTTGKVWETDLSAWKQKDGSWKIGQTVVRLNKYYPIVAWNDEIYTNRSQRNG